MGRLSATIGVALAALLACGTMAFAEDAKPAARPDQIDYAMFPLADVRDSPECRIEFSSGQVGFGSAISNPSMSCPDSFAWSLFVRAVSQKFWEDWSTDRQVWPSDPWPRCRPGAPGDRCCPAVVVSNDVSPEHCPVFPGPTAGVPAHQVRIPATAHQMSLDQATNFVGPDGKGWANVPAVLKSSVIGALQDELIFRNRPMVDYVFDNELYHTEGLIRVFGAYVDRLGTYAPRRAAPPDPAIAHPTPPPLARIDFPISAIMVKANWLAVERAAQVGIDPYDDKNPFIMMNLVPRQKAGDAGPPASKPYILLSMHISSKDVPNWTWSTFEHVNNQGRCDWTGCNDSFGYLTTTGVPDSASLDSGSLDSGSLDSRSLGAPAKNYLGPNKRVKVDEADVDAFDLARRYADGGEISAALKGLFAQADIGTGAGINSMGRPNPTDAAWRSYRLKGTQVDFVTSTGVPTRLGNSVTEAGFVNSASCISCHSRAAVTRQGVPAFAIFNDRLSDAGLPESVNGAPNPAWFSVNAFFGRDAQLESPNVLAVQTDFVWGFRFACPMEPRPLGPSWCKNLTSKGYSTPVPSRPMP
jgi:hypothetical protein